MTVLLESLDGRVIDTGFWGPDQSKVQLGDLPSITTQQFVGYGVLALTEGLLRATDSTIIARLNRGHITQELCRRVSCLSTLKITGQFYGQDLDALLAQRNVVTEDARSEWLTMVYAASTPTSEALYYPRSPFMVQADGQRVGLLDQQEVRHVVNYVDFFALTCNVIQGGNGGWQGETYVEVKEAALRLDEALTRYGPGPIYVAPT